MERVTPKPTLQGQFQVPGHYGTGVSVLTTVQGEIDRTLLKHNMTNENTKDCTDEVFKKQNKT